MCKLGSLSRPHLQKFTFCQITLQLYYEFHWVGEAALWRIGSLEIHGSGSIHWSNFSLWTLASTGTFHCTPYRCCSHGLCSRRNEVRNHRDILQYRITACEPVRSRNSSKVWISIGRWRLKERLDPAKPSAQGEERVLLTNSKEIFLIRTKVPDWNQNEQKQGRFRLQSKKFVSTLDFLLLWLHTCHEMLRE